MAIDIEKNISTLIESQFPEVYREEGEKFIAFVKAYYEWMEQPGGVIYHSRRLTEYRDIDSTIEDFIVDFKNKYLSNVQFNTATNKQLFIKNALDFYRAKGTERAVDLFFKLIHGLEAQVYYPADDIFKLSDNTWLDTQYIELRPNPNNILFVGQQVFGNVSGAMAFAERLTRVKKDNQYIEVLYITDITKDFKTGERITTEGLSVDYSAKITGSLTSFEITVSTPNFEVGEVVYISDGLGKKAKATVQKTADYVGVVNFELVDGGWGYSDQAQVIASERVIRFDNLSFTDDKYFYNLNPIEIFDTLQQDLVSIKVDSATLDSVYDVPLGTEMFAYTADDPANTVIWQGLLVYKNKDSSIATFNYTDADYRDANGDLIIDLFGNTGITQFYTSDSNVYFEVDTADISAVSDASAVANIIHWDEKFTIEYTSQSLGTTLTDFDVLYQEVPEIPLRYVKVVVANTFANTFSDQVFANVARESNWPRNNLPLIRESDGAKFNIVNVSNAYAGVIGVQGQLTETTVFNNANTYNVNTGMTASRIDQFSSEITAQFNIFEYEDQQSLRSWDSAELVSNMPNNYADALGGFANADLDFVIEDFSELGNTTVWDTATSPILYISEGGDPDFANTTIQDFLNIPTAATELGSLKSIITTNPGRGYSRSPYYIIFDPADYHMERYDFTIKYNKEAELKAFRVGEKITCSPGTGDPLAEGRLVFHDPNKAEMRVVRTRISNGIGDPDHLYTSHDFRQSDSIIGEDSGVSAVIFRVNESRVTDRVGLNADVTSEAFSGTGFATGLRILSSGFGYFGKRRVDGRLLDGEVLTLISTTEPSRTISGYGYLGKQGAGEGYWPSRRSFLSTDKYLADNDFYQEYSYQVLTSLPFDKYKQTLVEILHTAGTKPFGGYVGTQEDFVNITATGVDSHWEIKQYGLFINENSFYSNTTISLA